MHGDQMFTAVRNSYWSGQLELSKYDAYIFGDVYRVVVSLMGRYFMPVKLHWNTKDESTGKGYG